MHPLTFLTFTDTESNWHKKKRPPPKPSFFFLSHREDENANAMIGASCGTRALFGIGKPKTTLGDYLRPLTNMTTQKCAPCNTPQDFLVGNVKPGVPPCIFFNNGHGFCRNGDKCTYSHVIQILPVGPKKPEPKVDAKIYFTSLTYGALSEEQLKALAQCHGPVISVKFNKVNPLYNRVAGTVRMATKSGAWSFTEWFHGRQYGKATVTAEFQECEVKEELDSNGQSWALVVSKKLSKTALVEEKKTDEQKKEEEKVKRMQEQEAKAKEKAKLEENKSKLNQPTTLKVLVEEKRAARDGEFYTKDEFITFFGECKGIYEWQEAVQLIQPSPSGKWVTTPVVSEPHSIRGTTAKDWPTIAESPTTIMWAGQPIDDDDEEEETDEEEEDVDEEDVDDVYDYADDDKFAIDYNNQVLRAIRRFAAY